LKHLGSMFAVSIRLLMNLNRKRLSRREKIDRIAVGVMDDRIALTPNGVPWFFVTDIVLN